jgi:DNA-binding response OmpR family regulator
MSSNNPRGEGKMNNNNNSLHNKLLLVDDEPDITTVFALGLEDHGFKVDVFNDPLQALSDFKKGSYDLVLIDYKMPNMNGFELHREIRKMKRLRCVLSQRLKYIMRSSTINFNTV